MELATKRKRIRHKIKKVATLPRLVVHKTNKYMYAQLIDDQTGNIIHGASNQKMETKSKENRYQEFGEQIGKAIKAKKIDAIVFDRSGYLYHGKIQQFADGVRKAGVKF